MKTFCVGKIYHWLIFSYQKKTWWITTISFNYHSGTFTMKSVEVFSLLWVTPNKHAVIFFKYNISFDQNLTFVTYNMISFHLTQTFEIVKYLQGVLNFKNLWHCYEHYEESFKKMSQNFIKVARSSKKLEVLKI